MAKRTKLQVYVEYARKQLEAGASKAGAARSLHRKYPHLKKAYFEQIIYQNFSGKYNKNSHSDRPVRPNTIRYKVEIGGVDVGTGEVN